MLLRAPSIPFNPLTYNSAVASAVIPPEEADHVEQTESTLKRRQPSDSPHDSKRRRISQDDIKNEADEAIPSPPQASQNHRLTERRRHGQLEERKRGQRLLGALLGTLSQSSSSTAQKRRTDIENKQRTKLKLQTEEENEKRKSKLEALTEVRRSEQRKFDQQSVCNIHETSCGRGH